MGLRFLVGATWFIAIGLRTGDGVRTPGRGGSALFTNRLPSTIKSAPMPKVFKDSIKSFLALNVFYSAGECLAVNWEPTSQSVT